MRFDRIPSQRFHEQTSGCAFTDEELLVLQMRRKNTSIISIADQLHISEATVNRRIRSIKDKIAGELF
jgi:DNA-binding NarL/FixJ family response regulator